MKKKMKVYAFILSFLMCFMFVSATKISQEKNQLIKKEKEKSVITKHQQKIGDKLFNYTATVGKIPLRDSKGKKDADIFYIAYTKDGVKDKNNRPVMFSFNGGPGSSSIWMHMAFLGPKKILYDDEGIPLPPPYKVVNNEYSILDYADLVFIDPVATGYSRMVKGSTDLHKYHGIMEDIQAVGEFIRIYVSRNERWGSPKFVIGESYGTTRAAGLTAYLQNQYKMYINGTVFVSTMMLGVKTGADMNFALILPHYAATAWYHKQLSSTFQNMKLPDFLKKVEGFAMNEYVIALMKGGKLPGAKRTEIIHKLAEYTGLSKEFIDYNNLRIEKTSFRQELLKDQKLTVGRLDSRYTAIKTGQGWSFMSDPAMNAWNGPFSGALHQYMAEELKFKTDLEYAVFGKVHPWKGWDKVNVGQMLRGAMIQNPHLNILVLEGYYDAACDYFSAQYTFSHIDINDDFKDRIQFKFYESGHMMYLRKVDLKNAKNDLVNFMNKALKKCK